MTPLPHDEKICTGRSLAEILGKIRLSTKEAKEWRRDLRHAHRTLKAPVDKWGKTQPPLDAPSLIA